MYSMHSLVHELSTVMLNKVMTYKYSKSLLTSETFLGQQHIIMDSNVGSFQLIFLQQLKLGFIAQSCLSPGFSTLLANVFSMRSNDSVSLMIIKLKNKLNNNNECSLPLSVDALMVKIEQNNMWKLLN